MKNNFNQLSDVCNRHLRLALEILCNVRFYSFCLADNGALIKNDNC